MSVRAGSRLPGSALRKPERQEDLGAWRGVGDRGSGCLMPRCDRGDEGTALICLALILEAVVVVECKSQDMMETGSSPPASLEFQAEELMRA